MKPAPTRWHIRVANAVGAIPVVTTATEATKTVRWLASGVRRGSRPAEQIRGRSAAAAFDALVAGGGAAPG